MSDVLRKSLRGFGTSIFSTITQQAVQAGAINLAQGFPDFDPPEGLVGRPPRRCTPGSTSTRRASATRCCGRRSPSTSRTATAWRRPGHRGHRHRRRQRGDHRHAAGAARARRRGGAGRAVLRPLPVRGGRRRRGAALPDHVVPGLPARPGPAGRAGHRPDQGHRGEHADQPDRPAARPGGDPGARRAGRAARRVPALRRGLRARRLRRAARTGRSPPTRPARDRTITVSSVSKTFSATGWRIGWAVAPPALSAAVRSMHQFVTFTAPTPLQRAPR